MNEQYATNGCTRKARTIRERSTGRQLVAASVLFAMTWQPVLLPEARAAFSPPMIQLFDAPFLVGERVPPFVMLAVTKDQQLFKKAYDDFSDLNRDGVTDTTYSHAHRLLRPLRQLQVLRLQRRQQALRAGFRHQRQVLQRQVERQLPQLGDDDPDGCAAQGALRRPAQPRPQQR